MTFTIWLAEILNENPSDVERLLKDETALHFLITWNIFESKCFSGYLKAKCLKKFAGQLPSEGFSLDCVSTALEHFYTRYQHQQQLENLLHSDKTPSVIVDEFKRCLNIPLAMLQPNERVFLVAFVVYRFRNNIFHGNKRVESWLRFREQINLCTNVMQQFITHAESLNPTMQTE